LQDIESFTDQPLVGRRTLAAFWSEYAFTAGRVDYTQLDVALGAMAHNEWAPFERRLTEGLACEARARAEHKPAAQDALDQAALSFRYERDLIAAADMDAWLDRESLSLDDWLAFLARDVLRRAWFDELDGVVERYTPSAKELQEAAVIEGVCAGAFDAWQRSCAARVALALQAHDVGQLSEEQSIHAAEATRLMRQHVHWLTTQSPTTVESRLRAMLRVGDRFRSACDQIANPTTLSSLLDVHRQGLILVEVDAITFATEHAAREAVLCVREDGLSMHDVGVLSRHTVCRERSVVEDLPPELGAVWGSATTGQVLGPRTDNGRFEVSMVIARTLPTLDDEYVAVRLRQRAIEMAAASAVRAQISDKSTREGPVRE
jgi:hypothetical protein